MKLHVRQIEYHRNGVCGEPFHVVAFRWGRTRLIAIVFETPWYVAVITPDGPGGLADRWRGDDFEVPLREAIERWTDEQRAKIKETAGT